MVLISITIYIILFGILLYPISKIPGLQKKVKNTTKPNWMYVILVNTVVAFILTSLIVFSIHFMNEFNTNDTIQDGLDKSSVSVVPMYKNTIRIVSFNMYQGICKDVKKSFKKFNSLQADIICTQEDNGYLDAIGKYLNQYVCGNGNEIMGVYSKHNIYEPECITIKSTIANIPDRHAIVFYYNGLKIANIHLEGGRYADQILFNEFSTLLNYKLKLLEKVLEQEPDIIVGDFNSVYSSNNELFQQFLNRQYTWFSKLYQRELTMDEKRMIDTWNSSPFKLLHENQYAYAIPQNEMSSITNGRGGTIVDCIFYKSNRLEHEKGNILNLMTSSDNYQMYECVSDHNPIVADFTMLYDI